MTNDQLTKLLFIILIIMIGLLGILVLIFIILKIKTKLKHVQKKPVVHTNVDSKNNPNKTNNEIEYSKKSINSFMKFDKIEDSMIIANKHKKYIMVIECQGINYDLMSGVEKASTEQAFLQFLNTLRYPIQIHVQTRTVNLGKSIVTYRDRLKRVENSYMNKKMEYNAIINSGQYREEQVQKARIEMIREKNLYEYGIDIINNTERMSLNKNILRKHYYLIISSTPEEALNSNFGEEEVKDIAFNELYTKCQSLIGSIGVCGVSSKILNSVELAELLYVAYNRDDSEIYDIERALNARYDELYSTAHDVLDRKMKALDEKIEEEAIKKANDALLRVAEESKKEKEVRKKEEQLNDLINQMAKIIIDENESFVGNEMAEKAKEVINNENQGG